MKVPFAPPYINKAVEEEVLSALRSGWITTGPKVKLFEQELAKITETPAVLAVNSGTSALSLALHWFGIGRGDEVIIPAYTYAATALSVMHSGAIPVMVDVGTDFNMAPEKIREKLTDKTKAIIPVDIGGLPFDYDVLTDLLKNYTFKPANETQRLLKRPLILADAAHSIGGSYKGRPVGVLADITVLSFHAVKNITTAEGGALCLNLPEPFNNGQLYNQLRIWSLNGQTKDAFTKSKAGGWKYDIIHPGFKMNMPDVLAAIGLAQIVSYKTQILRPRRKIFNTYNEGFKECKWAQLPVRDDGISRSSCHLYQLRIKDITEEQRDMIIVRIADTGVAVNVHFLPLPMLSIFKNNGISIDDYPVAYDNYSREISLPLYPQLTDQQIDYVVNSVASAVSDVI
jgi:dTDP-4-amino-4,6-dideoxygalactose transaminase